MGESFSVFCSNLFTVSSRLHLLFKVCPVIIPDGLKYGNKSK